MDIETDVEAVTPTHFKISIKAIGFYDGPVGDFTPSDYLAIWRQVATNVLEASYIEHIKFDDGTTIANEVVHRYTYTGEQPLPKPLATVVDVMEYQFNGNTMAYETLAHCFPLLAVPPE